PSLGVSSSSADLPEWTFRLGPLRVTRTALLLRGRQIALLADQVEGRAERVGMRVALPAGIEAAAPSPDEGRVHELRVGRSSARVVPIGLSRRPGLNDRGTLAQQGRELRLSQGHEGR